jgi:hypothetical protein
MLVVEATAGPGVTTNTFVGTRADSVSAADPALLTQILRDNWFLDPPAPAPVRPGRGRR